MTSVEEIRFFPPLPIPNNLSLFKVNQLKCSGKMSHARTEYTKKRYFFGQRTCVTRSFIHVPSTTLLASLAVSSPLFEVPELDVPRSEVVSLKKTFSSTSSSFFSVSVLVASSISTSSSTFLGPNWVFPPTILGLGRD